LHPNSSPLAEAERQLELQRQLIVALTPELYRQLALYLQVLRKGLLHSVQQACFHLATQTYPERFSAIGASRRLELQQRLQALVQRCNCLLTVEQLMGLACQLQSRQQRQWRRDQQRLLLALAGEHGNGDGPGELESNNGGQDGGQESGQVSGQSGGQDGALGPGDSRHNRFGQPRGSVQLGLDLPLSADLFATGLDGLGSWLAGFATQGDLQQGDLGQAEVKQADVIEADAREAAVRDDEIPDQELPDDEIPDDEVNDDDVSDDEVLEALQEALGEPEDQPETWPLAAPQLEPLSPLAEVEPSGSRPPDPGQAEPAPLQGEGPEPDRVDGPPLPGDRSALPQQGTASPAPPWPPASPGVGQPPRPEAASDGPRRPRRPPLRRSPAPGAGRPWSAAPDGPTDDVQFFQSLFAMAAEGLGRETPGLANPGSPGSGQGESGQGGSGQGAAEESPDGLADSLVPAESPSGRDGGGHGAIPLDLLRQAGGLGPAPDLAGWQSQDSLMPQDAPSLLAWWEALDGALQRRLRNLSNAVNGELLRLGITRSPLPIALLDAVLKGQLDPQPAPANLVRLQMPFGGDSPASPGGDGPGAFPLGGPLDLVALLLRPTDLEFETPSLRVCRRRLEQNRSRLRTMAQRHRYWQRRVQALEAERQWFQDSPPTSREPA